MFSSRQSILTRRIRGTSRANEEHLDKEFEKQRALEDARRRKYQETEAYLRRSRFKEATPEEKVLEQQSWKESHDIQLTLRQKSKESEREYARVAAEEHQELEKVQEVSNMDEQRRKREEAREVSRVNQQLAEAKKAREKLVKQQENELENRNLAIQLSQRRNFRWLGV